MTDQLHGNDQGIGRRRVLRLAGAGVAGAVGVAAGTDEAAASYCPRPPGYWADAAWPATARDGGSLALVDPDDERSVASWKLLLAAEPANPGEAMARQLLAARLNFQVRPAEDAACVDRPVDAHGGRTVRELTIAATDWLRASDWPAAQSSWIVDGVDGEALQAALAAFNSYGFEELECHCVGLAAGTDDDAGTDDGDAPGDAPDARLRDLHRRRRLLGRPGDDGGRGSPSP